MGFSALNDFFIIFETFLELLKFPVLAARNHINRLCLAARVPLIESGSSGYLGHASLPSYFIYSEA